MHVAHQNAQITPLFNILQSVLLQHLNSNHLTYQPLSRLTILISLNINARSSPESLSHLLRQCSSNRFTAALPTRSHWDHTNTSPDFNADHFPERPPSSLHQWSWHFPIATLCLCPSPLGRITKPLNDAKAARDINGDYLTERPNSSYVSGLWIFPTATLRLMFLEASSSYSNKIWRSLMRLNAS